MIRDTLADRRGGRAATATVEAGSTPAGVSLLHPVVSRPQRNSWKAAPYMGRPRL